MNDFNENLHSSCLPKVQDVVVDYSYLSRSPLLLPVPVQSRSRAKDEKMTDDAHIHLEGQYLDPRRPQEPSDLMILKVPCYYALDGENLQLFAILSRKILRLVILAILFGSTISQQMTLVQNYSGDNFFDLWNYKTGNDVQDFFGLPGNNGNVNWTSQGFAASAKLIYTNRSGNTIIRVDNFTTGTSDTFGRNSVQMVSKDEIKAGSLVILDVVHMPFGCSVWPAFYMIGGANWPAQGEIDIIGNVNLATENLYSLVTVDGCNHPPAGQVNETGTLGGTGCSVNPVNTGGCFITDSNLSFGSGFANNGGGIFAMLWDDNGIKMWFFPRNAPIPSDISAGHPAPGSWPTPAAFYPSSFCDTSKFFGPQTMIFATNVCGNYATAVFSQTCQGKCADLIADPKNYDNAYWEIKYMTVFSSSSSSAVSPQSSTTASMSANPSTTPSNSSVKNHSVTFSNRMKIIGGTVGALVAVLLTVSVIFVRARKVASAGSSRQETEFVNPFFDRSTFRYKGIDQIREKNNNRRGEHMRNRALVSLEAVPGSLESPQPQPRFRMHEDSGEDIIQPDADVQTIDLPPVYDTISARGVPRLPPPITESRDITL